MSARRNFRNEIKKAIHDVQAVWLDCEIKADLEGVTVTKASPSVEKSRHVYSWISTLPQVSAPCGRFLYVLVRLRISPHTLQAIHRV